MTHHDEHQVHAGHPHRHAGDCGHTGLRHAGHTDYLDDGHLHYPHGDHVDEHRLSDDDTTDRPPGHTEIVHGGDHSHGPACGHEVVPHADHTDYLVDGHLHQEHGNHCDDHGKIATG
jgi:hypothetical protein